MNGYDLRSIVFAIKTLEEAQYVENKRHEAELQRIDLALQSAQARCTHPLTDYYPDASGNNDSRTDCQVCGKTL